MEQKVVSSSKDKILYYLKKNVSLTVNELSEYLNITHMAVRKHLSILETDGLIQSQEIRQPMGRPLQAFSLTERGEKLFPKNYEGIAIEFLQDLKELHGEEAVNTLFEKRKHRLTKEYLRIIEHKPVPDKMKALETIQNEKGYMVDVQEVDAKTYELVEYNCPILAIANEFKVACSCETQLFKYVLNANDVNRITCKTDGENQCKFLIKF